MSFISVALLSPPYSGLTYKIPNWMPEKMLARGMRVAVPLGRQGAGGSLRCAVVLELLPICDLPDDMEIKEVAWPLDKTPLLSDSYLHMLHELSVRQMASVGRILGSVLPFGLKTSRAIIRRFSENLPETIKLNSLKVRDSFWLAALAEDWQAGRAQLLPGEGKLAEIEYCTVCKDPPWPVRPSAKKQIELLEYLWEHNGKTRRQLNEVFGSGIGQAINALLKNKLLSIGPRPADFTCGHGEQAEPLAQSLSIQPGQHSGEQSYKKSGQKQDQVFGQAWGRILDQTSGDQTSGDQTSDQALDQISNMATTSSPHTRLEFEPEDILGDDFANSSEEARLEQLVESLAQLEAQLEAQLQDELQSQLQSKSAAEGPIPNSFAYSGGYLFKLTNEQRLAVEGLSKKLKNLSKLTVQEEHAAQAGQAGDAGQTALLHGITGSGKTAVYLELARICLEQGRSVLLLAPEVALACKLYREAKKYLPQTSIFLSHGYQSSLRREELFRKAAALPPEQPVLVCGTRSSLFLPLPNVGLIVLDEEHDASFKQDEGLVYQAKDLAYFRVMQDKALLLLGSATPDVRTFHASNNGLIPAYFLKQRLGQGGLPALEFVDIRGGKAADSILAPGSLKALVQTVDAGKQAIILLNRRGYSPLMYCLDCGQVIRCPNCEIGMTFHKARQRMVCHYCGHSAPFPSACQRCNSYNYLPLGEGTEKLEESLLPHLPLGTKILRLDRDTTRRPGRMEEILAAFARKEAQVLVGTQMLSKGHHFPEVTLAIVADADLGLNLPDYQAAERTFQLMLQSAGRAGRGDQVGRVIIQTRDPEHFCWEFVKNADYEGFFQKEIAMRKLRRYPPFSKLGLIRLSFPMNWEPGMELIKIAGQAAKCAAQELGVVVLGPAPAPLSLLRGQKRFQCLLKANDWTHVRGIYSKVLAVLPASSKLRVSLDIDPGSMM